MRDTLNYKILKITLAFVASAFFIGCEGKFDESRASSALAVDEATQIFEGDEVVPDGSANIDVVHRLSDDTKWVTLKSGTATLLRGDYTLVK